MAVTPDFLGRGSPPSGPYAVDAALIAAFAAAVTSSSATLAVIIPPSIPAIVIGPVANTSVGDVFIGMLIPGTLLALAYVAYILIRCTLRPEDGPPPRDDIAILVVGPRPLGRSEQTAHVERAHPERAQRGHRVVLRPRDDEQRARLRAAREGANA